MNDQDLNLIVDLIESELSNSEAESALARIMADPELSAAYAEQLAVHASLAELPIASMTVAERDALNSALVSQLQLEAAAAVVPIARKKATLLRKSQRNWWFCRTASELRQPRSSRSAGGEETPPLGWDMVPAP